MRLHFSSTNEKLYGRESELLELRRVYAEVKRKGRLRFVLLDGYSGNGKSSLAYHFGKSVTYFNGNSEEVVAGGDSRTETGSDDLVVSKPKRKYFIKGKFDERNQKPYAAFVQAFGDLVSHIIRNKQRERKRIEAIRVALGTESDLLVDVIPQLRDLLETKSTASNNDSLEVCSTQRLLEVGIPKKSVPASGMLEQRHQFRFRLRAFIRALCNGQPQPLVLFFDDLQWADVSSMDLLKTILLDRSSSNLLVIGAYRGHEICSHAEHHPLVATLKHLRDPDYFKQGIIELTLGDLRLDDLNTFIADSLELSPVKTLGLSEVIQRKTHGNIFYSKEFLKHLVAQKLVRYDLKYYQWMWEIAEITGQTNLSDNVIELVASRIQVLPSNVIEILKIASCLWFSFDVTVLEFIVMHANEKMALRHQENMEATFSLLHTQDVNAEKIDLCTQSQVKQGLLLATEHGLLDQLKGGNGFKFAHDRIREATYSLIDDEDERERMHRVIGELLWCMYHSDKSQQWMLFSAVDQLNKVSAYLGNPQLRVELAEVNLEAAECASVVSAFLPAVQYLKAGINLLGDGRWEKHYPLCLALYSKLAALEALIGHADDSKQLISEAIERAAAFDDKLSFYITLVESLSVQGKMSECLDLGFGVLKGLGEQFPGELRSTVFKRRVRRDKETTRRLLSKHTAATILNLPLLEDNRKIFALKIMNLMVDSAFHTGQMQKLYLIINRMVRISVIHGLSDVTGVAFALYGFSLESENGDRRENYRYGRLAVLLQEKLNATHYDCRVLVYVYVLLNHWQEPLQKSLNPLLAAHSVGMEKGDIDYAFQAAGAFLTIYWYSGNDLKTGVGDMKTFIAQMKEYKQDKALAIYSPLFQCMLNATGPCEEALLLQGDVISDEELAEKKFTNTTIMSYQMQLAYYFDDIALAEKLAAKLHEVSKSFNAHYLFVARLFFFGMIALRVAFDATGRRQKCNVATARRVIKEMEQWTKYGGLNCLHKLMILKAEIQAFSFLNERQGCCSLKTVVDFEAVREAFDTAISTATRTGFHNDAAVANERASAFCQRSGQKFYVEIYRSQAIDSYKKWGALAKVEQMTVMEGKSVAFELDSTYTSVDRHRFRDTATTDHGNLSHVGHDSTTSVKASMFSDGALLASAVEGLEDVEPELEDGFLPSTTNQSVDNVGSKSSLKTFDNMEKKDEREQALAAVENES